MTGPPRIKDYPGFLDAWGSLARAPRKSDAPTAITTFCGAGGSSTGLRMAGFDVRLGVDFWDLAIESYNANWPGTGLQADLTAMPPDKILSAAGLEPGQLDHADGSPPCQGVSLAGKRQLDDPRNQLFVDFGRFVKHARPRTFVMENVAGMLRGKMRPLFREVTDHLRGLGYDVRVKVLDASWLGVPQERHRLIWIGVRKDMGLDGLLDLHPAPTWRPPSLAQGLDGVIGPAKDAQVYGGGNRDADNVEPYLRRPARDEGGGRLVPASRRAPKVRGAIEHKGGCNENDDPSSGPALRTRTGDEPAHALGYRAPRLKVKSHMGGGVPRLDDRPAPTVSANEPPRIEQTYDQVRQRVRDGQEEPSRTIGAGKTPVVRVEQNVRQSRHKVREDDKPSKAITAGHPAVVRELDQRRSHGGATPRGKGKPGPTITGKAAPQVRLREVAHGFKPESLRDPARPAPAVTTDPWDREVDDGSGWRRMTPRECGRLQSVPDWYRLEGAATHQIRQLGNMVPPVMMAQVACTIAHRVYAWPDAPRPLEVSRPWTR